MQVSVNLRKMVQRTCQVVRNVHFTCDKTFVYDTEACRGMEKLTAGAKTDFNRQGNLVFVRTAWNNWSQKVPFAKRRSCEVFLTSEYNCQHLVWQKGCNEAVPAVIHGGNERRCIDVVVDACGIEMPALWPLSYFWAGRMRCPLVWLRHLAILYWSSVTHAIHVILH